MDQTTNFSTLMRPAEFGHEPLLMNSPCAVLAPLAHGGCGIVNASGVERPCAASIGIIFNEHSG